MEIEGFAEFADEMRQFADEIAAIKRGVPQAIDRGIETTVEDMAETMRATVAVKTGKTKRSIEVHHDGLKRYRITAGEASIYLEHGTDPHVIRADSATALKFQWPDAPIEVYERFAGTFPVVFFKRVKHPGTSKSPFFYPAIRKHQNQLGDNVFEELGDLVDRELS